jgi:hypothetical protein
MIFHPYAPWFGWNTPPMQYELFYLRLTQHKPNALDSSTRPRKDRFYPKNQLNVMKSRNSQIGQSGLEIRRFRFSHLELATQD